MKTPKSSQQSCLANKHRCQSSTKAPRHLYTNVHKNSDLSHEAVKKKEDGRGRKTKKTTTTTKNHPNGRGRQQTFIHELTKGLIPIHGLTNRASSAFFFFPSFPQIWLQGRHTRKIEKFRNCAIFC